jgi:hypothetical protein
MIIMAGSSISDADFHFADWIDRHGRAPPANVVPKLEETFAQKHSAVSTQFFLKSRIREADCAGRCCIPKENRNYRVLSLRSGFQKELKR